MAILTGILLGLSTLAFIGPVLFYLLKSSMESGVKAGISVAVGIIVGDIIYVLLALYGASEFFTETAHQKWFALAGGLILFVIGLKYALKPDLKTDISGKIKRKSLGVYFLNGFLINFVNPFVFAVWLGFLTLNQSMYSDRWTFVSLAATLLVIFLTDVIKAFFATKLMKLVQPKQLAKIFRIFGIIMILFAGRLAWTFYTL
jgi:threonine/homoserine/homoserine lactone efflux protein